LDLKIIHKKKRLIGTRQRNQERKRLMRQPLALAIEIEKELDKQCPEKDDYLAQAKAILWNLKDPKNMFFGMKVMVGFFKPAQLPKLTPRGMALNENKGQMFTCSECEGAQKMIYFQMQTTIFAACVTCKGRWKWRL
jgi:DNA-directed RNA polymerase subunit M/transcription elongation factor TFIIS